MNDLPEKLGEKAIEESLRHISEGARDFLRAIGGEALIQTGGMIGDQFKFWRFKNSLRLVDQAADILRKRGVDPTKVLPSHWVPLLEAASLEEDDSLKEKWAALLANAADPTKRIGITAAYTVTLQQLSSAEVELLSALYGYSQYEQSLPAPTFAPTDGPALMEWIGQKDGVYIDMITDVLRRHSPPPETFDAIVTNLVRLDLVVNPAVVRDKRTDGVTYPQLSLTGFGKHFMKACSA